MTDTHDSYDPRYFEPLFATEDRHFWFLARNRVICRLAANSLRDTVSGKILEVGCGTGFVLRALEKEFSTMHVTGMDLFLEGLRLASKRVTCGLVQGDLAAPPFMDGFDLVGMFDVLEHIEDDRAVLDHLYHLVKPGGSLLLTVPADPGLWSYFDVASCHFRRYSLKDLQEKVQTAGFSVNFISPFIALTYPALRIQRLLMNRSHIENPIAAGNQAEDDLKIVPVINDIVREILYFEAGWLARGHRLPFGSSLVLRATRPAI
ncbi:MAG: class I SAM-dependent methyltransferase [Chloroflexi bacterium]|nr:class I SAM-dependent methyltransferase [Chloroflexota bacterium]BCY19361.1 SAM-dependent methyltransferase [Leptolinea sp. HRD-7]